MELQVPRPLSVKHYYLPAQCSNTRVGAPVLVHWVAIAVLCTAAVGFVCVCACVCVRAVLGQLLFKCNSLHSTQLNYLVTVTYYPYNKVTIIILHIILLCVHSLKLSRVKLPLYHVT